MARCGCAQACACSVQGSETVSVAGNGAPGTPYVPRVVLVPDGEGPLSGDNALLEDALGLYVEPADSEDVWMLECAAEGGSFAAGVVKTFRAPFPCEFIGLRGSVTDPSTSGGPVTVDVLEAGASMLATLLTIDDGETTSVDAAAQPVIADPVIADDALMTIEVTDAGTDATALKVAMYVRRF